MPIANVRVSVDTPAARPTASVPVWSGSDWTARLPMRPIPSGYHVTHPSPSTFALNASTSGVALNQALISPIYTGGRGIDQLAVHEVTAATTGANLRVFVCADDPTTALYGNVLYAGVVDISAVGQPTALTGLSIPASPTGWHWIGSASEGVLSTGIRSWNTRTPFASYPSLPGTGTVTLQGASVLRTSSYGSAPSAGGTLPSVSSGGTYIPVIFARLA